MNITTDDLKEILKAAADMYSYNNEFDSSKFVISVIGELNESRKEIRFAIDGAKPEDLISDETIAHAVKSYLDDEDKPKPYPDTIRSNEPVQDKIKVDWSTNNKEWIDAGSLDKKPNPNDNINKVLKALHDTGVVYSIDINSDQVIKVVCQKVEGL